MSSDKDVCDLGVTLLAHYHKAFLQGQLFIFLLQRIITNNPTFNERHTLQYTPTLPMTNKKTTQERK